jgi:hypothetical protein
MMLEGVDRAEKLVQLYFSIVSIYKVLLVLEGGWTCRLSIRIPCDTMPFTKAYFLLINDHAWLPPLLGGFYGMHTQIFMKLIEGSV